MTRLLTALLITSIAAVVACRGAGEPKDPAAVIDAYTKAINAHNVEEALKFVDDNAVYMRPAGQFTGKAEVRTFIEGLVQQKVRIELVGQRQVSGERVTWTSRVFLTDPANPNAPPREVRNQSESVVRNGKIVSHRATPAP